MTRFWPSPLRSWHRSRLGDHARSEGPEACPHEVRSAVVPVFYFVSARAQVHCFSTKPRDLRRRCAETSREQVTGDRTVDVLRDPEDHRRALALRADSRGNCARPRQTGGRKDAVSPAWERRHCADATHQTEHQFAVLNCSCGGNVAEHSTRRTRDAPASGGTPGGTSPPSEPRASEPSASESRRQRRFRSDRLQDGTPTIQRSWMP